MNAGFVFWIGLLFVVGSYVIGGVLGGVVMFLGCLSLSFCDRYLDKAQ